MPMAMICSLPGSALCFGCPPCAPMSQILLFILFKETVSWAPFSLSGSLGKTTNSIEPYLAIGIIQYGDHCTLRRLVCDAPQRLCRSPTKWDVGRLQKMFDRGERPGVLDLCS